MGAKREPIVIPLRALHLVAEGEELAALVLLEPDALDGMSWLEVPGADFVEQAAALFAERSDLPEREATVEEWVALASRSSTPLDLSLFPGGHWELSLRPAADSGPHRPHCVRLERRRRKRTAPNAERTQLSVADPSVSHVSVVDVSEDGSGLAIDCDADELRALLMGGALREAGVLAIEIHVVRVQALGDGRYRVGCVVGRGQERARALLS